MLLTATFEFSHLVNILSGLLIVVFAGYKAFTTIFGNTKFFKERKDKKAQIEKEKRRKEREESLEEYSQKIVKPMIDDLKAENEKQNKRMDQLIKSSNDTLRQEITNIYYKYLPYKKIPFYAKESMMHMADDYIAQEGNSFVQGIVKEMLSWETTNTDEEARQKSI